MSVLLEKDHLDDNVDRRFPLQFFPQEIQDIFSCLFEHRAHAVLLVGLLARTVECKYHVIKPGIEQQVCAPAIEQCRIRRHAGSNTGFARDPNHFENVWVDHRLADAVGPDELDIVLTIVDDFPIKIQVHAFVVECVDVARTHRTVEIAFGRALKRDFDWTAVERGFVAKITECDVPTVP